MLSAQAPIAFQSRKSPSMRTALLAGSMATSRWEPFRLLRSNAPKKTRRLRGLMASLNSANSLGSEATRTSRPWGSLVAAPSGPLLNNHTGLVARIDRLRRTNSAASFSHDPMYAALPITRAPYPAPAREILIGCNSTLSPCAFKVVAIRSAIPCVEPYLVAYVTSTDMFDLPSGPTLAPRRAGASVPDDPRPSGRKDEGARVTASPTCLPSPAIGKPRIRESAARRHDGVWLKGGCFVARVFNLWASRSCAVRPERLEAE